MNMDEKPFQPEIIMIINIRVLKTGTSLDCITGEEQNEESER